MTGFHQDTGKHTPHLVAAMVWVWDVTPGPCVCIFLPACGPVWEDYGAFRRWSLAEGNGPLGGGSVGV